MLDLDGKRRDLFDAVAINICSLLEILAVEAKGISDSYNRGDFAEGHRQFSSFIERIDVLVSAIKEMKQAVAEGYQSEYSQIFEKESGWLDIEQSLVRLIGSVSNGFLQENFYGLAMEIEQEFCPWLKLCQMHFAQWALKL